MKRFRVNSVDETPCYGEQLATFSACVNLRRFRFVVLRMSIVEINLTERESGKRVDVLRVASEAKDDLVAAGRAALAALVAEHGEEHVADVLAKG